MQKIVSKSKFSELAGVNPSTVTRVSKTILSAAVVGKQIDSAHPDAVAYLEKQRHAATPPAAPGLDPLYQQAVESCASLNRWTPSNIQRACGTGYDRAVAIFETMKRLGVVPNVVDGDEFTETLKTFIQKSRKPVGAAAVKEAKKHAQNEDRIIEVPEDIEEFADMTLRELISRFGTDVRFVDWLKATQSIEAINEKRLKNAQTKGELVSRHLVKIAIIEPIESAHVKLMTDGAKTIARRAAAMAQAGKPVAEIEAFAIDQISSFIKPVKAKVDRALRNV
jgi:hypothetical protein